MVVKCIGIEKGKTRLSRKAALEEAKEDAPDDSLEINPSEDNAEGDEA
jgi:hypothetical protein